MKGESFKEKCKEIKNIDYQENKQKYLMKQNYNKSNLNSLHQILLKSFLLIRNNVKLVS